MTATDAEVPVTGRQTKRPDGAMPLGQRRMRSRITNGTRLLPSVHPQSVWGRIMKDTVDGLVSHLGGPDNVSETQRMACRRIAVLEVEMVFQEDRIGQLRCEGREPAPELLDLYCRLGNAQRRFCEALGWQRVPRDATPDIDQYIRAAAKTDAGA
jgi:hypothetical protein